MRYFLAILWALAANTLWALTPAIITSDQNNYNPPGFYYDAILYLETDAARNITGLEAPSWALSNQRAEIINIGAFNIVLKNESGSSSSANQFSIGTDVTIKAGDAVSLRYDPAALKWRVFHITASAGAGDMLGANNLSDVASAATSRTNLGATALGANLFTMTNPSAVRYIKINADNTVTARTAAEMLSDLGAQASGSYVTESRTVSTTSPLTGGGDLSANRTLALDLNAISTTDAAVLDKVPFTDVSASNVNAAQTLEQILSLYHTSYLPLYRYSYFTDFINTVSTAAGSDGMIAVNSGSAAATSAAATSATNIVGMVRSTTGTTAVGRTSVAASVSSVRLGGGEWELEARVNITALSTSAQRYQFVIGFFDTQTAANQVDGVYILYDEGGVSTGSTAAAYWQTATTSNSSRTFNTSLSQVTVAAGSWIKLKIIVNAAASSITFYVNGSAIATHTANIPTAAGRELGFGWLLIKTVGTTAHTIDFDYYRAQCDYTTTK